MSSLSAAVLCAANLLSLPVPADVDVVLKLRPLSPAECAVAGRATCAGKEMAVGRTMYVALDPQQASRWGVRVHAACHVVQFGNGLPWHGASAERQCDAVELRAAECR